VGQSHPPLRVRRPLLRAAPGPPSDGDTTDQRRAIDTVLAQFPLALETYLLSLPRTVAGETLLASLSVSLTGLCLSSVVSAAQSLTARLLLTFTSIACLRRPVNEQTRLLTATEISALDMMTTSLSAINAVSCRTFPSLDDALTELR
jgi:hypothetical protein